MKIYLDMDGVLTDFDKRYVELFGERPFAPEENRKHFWNNWKEFVDGKHFETLEVHPDAFALMQVVKSLKVPYEILSSSAGGYSHDEVIAQKKKWLAKHGINVPANFVPGGKHKAAYAKPMHVLVDDMKKNIDAYRAAGGPAIHHTNVGDTTRELIGHFIDKKELA